MKIVRLYLLLALSLGFFIGQAQEVLKPSDFLTSEFHKERRDELRKIMPAKSVAVFFANPVRNRSNDVDFLYHQDPNLYYLTGYQEPHAVLLIFKENQTAQNNESYNEIIFVQPRNEFGEMWTGRRLGAQGVKDNLKINMSFKNTDFANYPVDFSKFDKVLFQEFFNDVRDTREPGDLYDLIEQFKSKAGYNVAGSLETEPRAQNLDTQGLNALMSQLRGVKTEEEIALLRKAVEISAIGQLEVMKAMKPGLSEREIQGIHEFVFKKYGAEYEGYPSIVGGGHNGCILHYQENYKPSVSSTEMVLMDLGAEYRGYTADVTRTIPTKGTFSPEQKAIYDLVYEAQEAGIKKTVAGGTMMEVHMATLTVINEGLVELGIIKSADQRHMYYPHGCCHHIGLDVHDLGGYTLEENMVITVEPGIYIPADSDCDEKWWGIAVRIEDDILVTKDGPEILSSMAPRKSDEIEKAMKETSILDSFVLPELGKGKD